MRSACWIRARLRCSASTTCGTGNHVEIFLSRPNDCRLETFIRDPGFVSGRRGEEAGVHNGAYYMRNASRIENREWVRHSAQLYPQLPCTVVGYFVDPS